MKFFLTKPSKDAIDAILLQEKGKSFSYSEVGATKAKIQAGYAVDHNRIKLGNGKPTFDKAKLAIQRWTMFQLGWIELCWSKAPIEVGTDVAVLIRYCGLWSLNASRIVYLIDEKGSPERFGFAYGTLPHHAEKGEERFTVEWNIEDDSVWYDLLAFSRPNHVLSLLAYPFVRNLQNRFAKDSLAAMVKAVGSAEDTK